MLRINPKLIYFLIGLARDIYLTLFVMLLTLYKLNYINSNFSFAITSFIIGIVFILFNTYKEKYRDESFIGGLQ